MIVPIRIMVVDDHKAVRQSLSAFFEHDPRFELVAVASNSAEALTMMEEHKPDVILMDIQLPGIDGISATRTITKKHPTTCVIGLTGYYEQAYFDAIIHAGAVHCTTKDVLIDELAEIILSCYQRCKNKPQEEI